MFLITTPGSTLVAAMYEKAGGRLCFALTRQEAAGKWGAATYSLGAHEQRIGIIGTMGIRPDAPYDPYGLPAHTEATNSPSRPSR